MNQAAIYAKTAAFRDYVRARKLEVYNRDLRRKEIAERHRQKAERLEAEFPDFAEAYKRERGQ